MPSNDFYLAVLPLIHLNQGSTEETLTLFPDKNFATEFFPDQVDMYVTAFTNRTKYLTGGHVTGYEVYKEPTNDGRVIVRVVQKVVENVR
jgi:hypothetical protein